MSPSASAQDASTLDAGAIYDGTTPEAGLPECIYPPVRGFPPFPTFATDGPGTFQGRGVVESIMGTDLMIQIDGCCEIRLQRAESIPPLASAGEELDVSFVRGGGFANPEWGLTLREPGGRLRLLAYNGVFTEQRYAVLSSPFSIEFTEICSTESSCYTEETGLSVTVASLTDRVSLSLLERGSVMLEDEDYQVLLFGAGRNGDATGNCSNALSSGDALYLVVLPANVPY